MAAVIEDHEEPVDPDDDPNRNKSADNDHDAEGGHEE
jgi:hypothetical protein